MNTRRLPARDTVKRALAACTRAVARAPGLDVVFTRSTVRQRDDRVCLPEPPATFDATALAVIRGLGDAMALRRAHHDPGLHERLAPAQPQQRRLYDALEQVRVEAIGARGMRGVASNLAAALEHALAQKGASFEIAVALMVRERLTRMPPPASGAHAVALWCDRVNQQLGTLLDALPGYVHDQQGYAKIVRDHLALAGSALPIPIQPNAHTPGGVQAQATNEATTVTADHPAPEALTDAPLLRPARLRPAGPRADADAGYRIFTTAFDQVVAANALRTPQELHRLRGVLDRKRARSQVAVGRMSARLQRHLMALQNRAWQFDLDEGELDTGRLARIIIDPAQRLSFKQERESRFRDTTVTLLIDNSGSMQGRPIAAAAVCADMLACTLERCGVRVEILGFTTGAWQGGQARDAWVGAGRPADPGRLNALCHILYKTAEQPWRRARPHLGMMLCDELLKENIDGEALLWAHRRLLARPEQRRVLMVIADGAPADDATLSANPRDYLERHLRSVIHMLEKHSPVELMAVGIGHDLSRFYARATTIADPEQLSDALTDQLVRLFDREGPRRRPTAAPGNA